MQAWPKVHFDFFLLLYVVLKLRREHTVDDGDSAQRNKNLNYVQHVDINLIRASANKITRYCYVFVAGARQENNISTEKNWDARQKREGRDGDCDALEIEANLEKLPVVFFEQSKSIVAQDYLVEREEIIRDAIQIEQEHKLNNISHIGLIKPARRAADSEARSRS
jgi:hypothetical protein